MRTNEETQKIIEKRNETTTREVREELQRIASVGAGLTEADKAFIRARASYLNNDEKEMWKAVLKQKPTKAKEAATKEAELSTLSYNDLQVLASELGLKSVGVKREELEASITEIQNQSQQ